MQIIFPVDQEGTLEQQIRLIHNTTDSPRPLPAVIRSQMHIDKQKTKSSSSSSLCFLDNMEMSLDENGVTFTMAQKVAWLDLRHFVVGRWDGSMSIFKFRQSKNKGPLITKAVNTPSFEGVQMLAYYGPGLFASSNDSQSIVLWSSANNTWEDLEIKSTLRYDQALGVANSGASFAADDGTYLLVGHANGFVTIWHGNTDGSAVTLRQTIDVRSQSPTNPWGLQNVRGVGFINANQSLFAVTGSENGDICLIDVRTSKILSQIVYNPAAQRGINSIAVYENFLLVANCAVGQTDKNLWLYSINTDNNKIQLLDSKYLVIDRQLKQVFNFCVVWAANNQDMLFFSSTQEGALWSGSIENNKIMIKNHVVPSETNTLGAAMAFNYNSDLAYVAYNVYEFVLVPDLNIQDCSLSPESLAPLIETVKFNPHDKLKAT